MRRIIAVVGIATVAVVGLAACGATETDSNGRSVVTQPATQAQNTVNQQNQQLSEIEQRANQDDPTVP